MVRCGFVGRGLRTAVLGTCALVLVAGCSSVTGGLTQVQKRFVVFTRTWHSGLAGDSDAAIANLGESICNEIRLGTRASQVEQELLGPPYRVTSGQAVEIIETAVQYLCPHYANDLGGLG